jgi:4-amino-4-deoxy-L-arabinose transferase and related glycosyltransferases of PMT family
MTVRKNWFVYFSLVVFEICAVYALISGIEQISNSRAHPYLWNGGLLCSLALALGLVFLGSNFFGKVSSLRHAVKRRHGYAAERVIVAVTMLLSTALRIWTIAKLPITPSSDYQTYYQVAELLVKGGLSGSGYSGYIAEFPHVIGYSFVLSLLFRVTGPSVQAGLYLNLAASLLSVFLTYRIARSLFGRLAGMIALFLEAFWPSQILYGTILGSESVFTCMLLVCVWLFLYLYRYPLTLGNRESSLFLCVALGVAIALTNAVRPFGTILLIAAILCIVPCVIKFNKNEKMLNGRFSRASFQGWFLTVVISISFIICSQLVSASISNAIAYKLPSSSVSFGYNLMDGVNIQAQGAWNQQDADYFAKAFASTNSAQAAQQASRDIAFERIKSDPLGVLNLSVKKFTLLWGNDDYAKTWTVFFLGQQGNLTPERQNIIDQLTRFNNVFYLFAVFFSAVFGFSLFRQKNTQPVQGLILLFIGTAVLHMFLETQNRYHYFVLPVFAILASMAIADIYRGAVRRKTDLDAVSPAD